MATSDLLDFTRRPEYVLRLSVDTPEQNDATIAAVGKLVQKLRTRKFTSHMEYPNVPPAYMQEIEGGDPHCGYCYNRLTDYEEQAEHPDNAEGYEHCKECQALLGGWHAALKDDVRIVSIVEKGKTMFMLLVKGTAMCGITTGERAKPLLYPCPGAAFREWEFRTTPGALQKALARKP